jgi:hypothetical protein
MDFRTELSRLVSDTRALFHACRHRPRAVFGVWLLAALRVWVWHPDNNRFRKMMFFVTTVLVATLLVGQSGFGWRLPPIILFPLLAGWLVGFGVILGFEVERIKLGNIELDLQHGELNEADE